MKQGSTWVIDLDGVIWLGGEAIDGSAAALTQLRAAGHRAVFATNNSNPTTAELVARLERAGIAVADADVISSAEAVATLVEVGSTVLTLAGEGVRHALAAKSVRLVEEGPADAVVVGWTRAFDFDGLARAAAAVRAGARLLGTNDDATYPTPDGLVPGAGALLAAVATAAGVQPEVAGKPYPTMARLIARRAPGAACVVGDRPSTDGRLAGQLGVPFFLVLSGVTGAAGVAGAAVLPGAVGSAGDAGSAGVKGGVAGEGEGSEVPVELAAPDLAELVRRVLGSATACQ